MAEIHRCFSLLGREAELSQHANCQSQGRGGDTAGRTRYDVQTWNPGHVFPAPGHASQPCPHSPVPHPAGPEEQSRPRTPWVPALPMPLRWRERARACLVAGSSPPIARPTHSVCALSRNWCFACCPGRSWRRNTWPGMPWGFRLRSFTCSSAILAWTKTANFPSLQDGGGGEVSQASPSGPAKFRLKGEGVICPSRTFPKDSGPHRAPPPWQPASPQKEGELRPCQITNRWRVSRLAPDCRHASTFSPSLCPEPILRANGPTLR